MVLFYIRVDMFYSLEQSNFDFCPDVCIMSDIFIKSSKPMFDQISKILHIYLVS